MVLTISLSLCAKPHHPPPTCSPPSNPAVPAATVHRSTGRVPSPLLRPSAPPLAKLPCADKVRGRVSFHFSAASTLDSSLYQKCNPFLRHASDIRNDQFVLHSPSKQKYRTNVGLISIHVLHLSSYLPVSHASLLV